MKNTALFSRIGLWGAAALFCLPFLYPSHTLPIPAYYHEWLAGVLGLTMTLAVLSRAAWTAQTVPAIAIVPLGLLGLIAVQNLLGLILHPDQAMLASMYLALCISLMLATRALVNTYGMSHLATVLAWATLMGGLLNTLAAVLQHWEIHTPLDPLIARDDSGYIFGNLAQANHFADQQALALASLFYLSTKSPANRPIWALFGVALLIGLALSGSRTAWLYLFALVAMAYLLHRRQPGETGRRLLLVTTLAIPAFLLIQLGLHWLGVATPTDRLLSKLSAGTSLSVRLDMWEQAIRLFLQQPLTGVGFQNFAWANFLLNARDASTIYPEYLVREQIVFHNVHNLPLQLLAEFGLGAGVLLLALGYWVFRALRQTFDLERWWVWSLLAIIGIHSMLELPLWYLHFLAPFAVLLALADNHTLPLPLRPAVGRSLATLITLTGIFLLGLLFSAYSTVEDAYTYNPQRLDANSLPKVSASLSQARATGFFVPQIEIYMANMAFADTAPARKRAQLELGARAMQKMPTYSLIYRQIVLLIENGEYAEAERLLHMTARTYPYVMPDFAAALGLFAQTVPEAGKLARQASSFAIQPPTTAR